MESKNSSLESYYHTARSVFEEERYKDAADAFLLLTFLNPSSHSFWMGLASSEQMASRANDALKAYAMAALLDVTDPYPHFYSAQCYADLADRENMLDSLALSIEIAKEQDEHAVLKQEAEEIIKRVQNG